MRFAPSSSCARNLLSVNIRPFVSESAKSEINGGRSTNRLRSRHVTKWKAIMHRAIRRIRRGRAEGHSDRAIRLSDRTIGCGWVNTASRIHPFTSIVVKKKKRTMARSANDYPTCFAPPKCALAHRWHKFGLRHRVVIIDSYEVLLHEAKIDCFTINAPAINV